MLCFGKLPAAKKIMEKKVGITIFRRKKFVPQGRKLWHGKPFVLCFRKLPVANKITEKRGRGIKFFRRKSSVPQCRKLSQGNPIVLCFRKLPAAKKIMDNKGGYHDFPSKKNCLRVPKSFVGENFCAVFQKISGGEKLYG